MFLLGFLYCFNNDVVDFDLQFMIIYLICVLIGGVLVRRLTDLLENEIDLLQFCLFVNYSLINFDFFP